MGVKGLTTFSNKIFEEYASEKEKLLKKKIQELENEKGHLQEIKKVLDALNKELIINKEKQNEKCYTFDINMELFNALTRESDIRKIYYPTINEKNKISLIIDANSFYFYFASKINWLACDYSNFIEYLKFVSMIKNFFFLFKILAQ